MAAHIQTLSPRSGSYALAHNPDPIFKTLFSSHRAYRRFALKLEGYFLCLKIIKLNRTLMSVKIYSSKASIRGGHQNQQTPNSMAFALLGPLGDWGIYAAAGLFWPDPRSRCKKPHHLCIGRVLVVKKDSR